MSSNGTDPFHPDDELPEEEHVVSDTGPFALVPEWVIDHPDLQHVDIRFYCILNRFADRKSRAWPSRVTLAERLRCSVDTIDRATQRLVLAGALEVHERFHNGARTSNLYVLIRARARNGVRPPLRTDTATQGGTDAAQNESQLNERTTPNGVVAPAAPESDSTSKKRSAKRQLPEGFTVTAEMREWAAANTPAVDIDAELAQFSDYHRSNANTKADWVSAWRTWMRNAKKWGAGSRSSWAPVDRTHRNPANTFHEREGGSRIIQRPKSRRNP